MINGYIEVNFDFKKKDRYTSRVARKESECNWTGLRKGINMLWSLNTYEYSGLGCDDPFLLDYLVTCPTGKLVVGNVHGKLYHGCEISQQWRYPASPLMWLGNVCLNYTMGKKSADTRSLQWHPENLVAGWEDNLVFWR